MDLAPDFNEFIGSLTAHGVEFLVVGAYALAFHGAPRFTGDLGLLVRPTLANATRLLTALDAFGFPVRDLRPETIVDPRRMVQMGVPPVQIHVMSAISGVEWDEAWSDRVEGPLWYPPGAFPWPADIPAQQAGRRPAEGPRRHRCAGTRTATVGGPIARRTSIPA
jgi:hypothetical protein